MMVGTRERELNTEERTQICQKCPICDVSNWICNHNLYLNPNTNDISTYPKPGYIKGCGCLLSKKIPVSSKHCPAKKW